MTRMMQVVRGVCVGLGLILAAGCAVESGAPGDAEQTAAQDDSLAGGQACGENHCGKGTYCCNASCGTCAPIGSFCTQIACEPTQKCDIVAKCAAGYEWSVKACNCIPIKGGGKPGSCSVDSDCRLESDYCTGCDCRALSTNEKLPVCSGPGVRCFADPCLAQAATCVDGLCQVTAAAL